MPQTECSSRRRHTAFVAATRARSARGFVSLLSIGGWALVLIALIAAAAVVIRPDSGGRDTLTLWTFAPPHAAMYEPILDRWSAEGTAPEIAIETFSRPALERRMLGGFMSGVPVAELIEAERRHASRAFGGPVESVGFLDITDRLREDGLLEQINAESLGPWTYKGRVFGLPHDVHPVMLCYRADLVEAAGIDVNEIETWDDFARVMRPLMTDGDGDGEPDRYLISFWPAHIDLIEPLMLQGGDGLFDEHDEVRLATETNAAILASLATWVSGPNRIAADVPEFSAAGNKLKLEGYVVAAIMPDWLSNIWRQQLPELSGKLRLMPLPAWEPGGRRTSVWGGTMLGIPKAAKDHDKLWEIAKRLYLSPELSRVLYEQGDIITPVRALWDDPIYDEPDPFYSGQAKGRAYINLAPDVPRRTSSPFNKMALERVQDALIRLADEYADEPAMERTALEIRALHLLESAEREVSRRMERSLIARSGDG